MQFNEGNKGASEPHGLAFSITDGQVTAMQRVLGANTFNLKLPSNATFSVDQITNTVTETLTGSKVTETRQYTPDRVSTNLYHLTSETETVANPTTTNAKGNTSGYTFTITGGTVTGMQFEWGNASHTHTQNLRIPPASNFSVNGTSVSETLIHGNTVETLNFVQSESAGLYAVASDNITFIQQGKSATPLSVNPFDQSKFILDASGNVEQVQHVRADGTATTVTPNSNTTYNLLAPGYIIETVTHGANISFELYHDGNGDGIYTAIAHGSGTTVDLVGIQGQLSPAADVLT